MGNGFSIDTITKYFYDFIYRYRRNKSDRDKAKLKRLAKRDKEIAEELKPIQEQLKLLEEKEYRLVKESRNIEQVKEKILDKYKYKVRTRELNPNYAG
jgi:uncharacterized protein YozE (UPF0346 family)